jgi:5-methylcytosine-specific restriction protein A
MRTRERILSRDMGVCQCDECRATGAVKAATEVDHYVPLWKGGTDADENLRAINADCHRLKSAGEAAERGV